MKERRDLRELLALLPTGPELRGLLVSMVTENIGFKVLSLFVALGIWGFVQGERVVVGTTRVEVEYLMPEAVAFSRQPQDRLKLSVSGPRNRVRELKREKLTLEMDLREFTPGSPIVDFNVSEIKGIPDELTLLNLVPNSLQVELERKVVRQLALKAQTTGVLPEGYRLASVALDPPIVEVSGPASVVEARDAVSIRGIDLSRVTESGRLPVSVELPPGIRRTGTGPIFAEITLELKVEQRVFAGVPVTVRLGGWGASIDALEVTLEGPPKELDALTADMLTALVFIPPDTTPQQITVRRDPSKAARFRIAYEASDLVTVTNVKPNSFTVEPAE